MIQMTGDETMTKAQGAWLQTRRDEAGEGFVPSSKRIHGSRGKTGKGVDR
jgi:hypothetical protein